MANRGVSSGRARIARSWPSRRRWMAGWCMRWRTGRKEACAPIRILSARTRFPQPPDHESLNEMNHFRNTGAQVKIVSAAVLLVLGCILTAGLWPFHIERNGVSWRKDGDGLLFLSHGAAVSRGAFTPSRAPGGTGFSLELSLTPAETVGKGTFLAFDSSPDPRSPFKLSQFGTSLAVQRYWIGSEDGELSKVHRYWFKVSRVFRKDQQVFVTITSNRDGTSLYLNGGLAGTSPDPGIADREL